MLPPNFLKRRFTSALRARVIVIALYQKGFRDKAWHYITRIRENLEMTRVQIRPLQQLRALRVDNTNMPRGRRRTGERCLFRRLCLQECKQPLCISAGTIQRCLEKPGRRTRCTVDTVGSAWREVPPLSRAEHRPHMTTILKVKCDFFFFFSSWTLCRPALDQ